MTMKNKQKKKSPSVFSTICLSLMFIIMRSVVACTTTSSCRRTTPPFFFFGVFFVLYYHSSFTTSSYTTSTKLRSSTTTTTCNLKPYDLRVEHLKCRGSDNDENDGVVDPTSRNTLLVVIDPNPEILAPRFSWKAALTSTSNNTLPTSTISIPSSDKLEQTSSTKKNMILIRGHPKAMASQVQVIRRRKRIDNKKNDQTTSQDEIVWDSGWLRLGRRNGLEVYRQEGQLPGLVEAEVLHWRARFAISSLNDNEVYHNDHNHNTSNHETTTIIMPSSSNLQACEWSYYASFVVGLSHDTWDTADWLCSSDVEKNAATQQSTAKKKNEDMTLSSSSSISDCDMYDTTTGKAAAPLFRTEFEIPVSDEVERATLFVTGLGHYEAWMNGIHINSGRYLDPAPSSYDKRVYYNTFDVTHAITTTSNSNTTTTTTTVVVDATTRGSSSPSPTVKQVLGLLAGNGWFNPLPLKFWGRLNLRNVLPVGTPRVRCILYIFFRNRSSPMIVRTETDKWQTASSGLYRNDLYLGNVVDLDRHQALENWSTITTTPGLNNKFDNSIEWRSPQRCTDTQNVSRRLQPQPIPPIRARPPYILSPVSQQTTKDGNLVLDMGLNTAAAIHVEMNFPLHYWNHLREHQTIEVNDTDNDVHEIEFRFGELLWPNGTVNYRTSVAGQIKNGNGGSACAPTVAYQRLTLRGTKLAFSKGLNFTTQFTWAGFRYIEMVDGASLLLQRQGASGIFEDNTEHNLVVQAIPLMTDLEWTSSFDSSNSLLNKIYHLCVNTHASNMMGIQSDCPHRERFGYTGDALATMSTSLLLFGDPSFYEKRLLDTGDSQRLNGGITETAPFVGLSSAGLGGSSGPIGWDTYFVELQIQLRRYLGTVRSSEAMQNNTRRWIEFLEASDDDLVENGLGDWMATDQTSTTITGRAFFVANLRAWSLLTESSEESTRTRKLAMAARRKFNDMFVNSSTGEVTWNGSSPTQTGQAVSLFYRLVPRAIVDLVSSKLIESIEARGNHLSTGMFGTTWLFETLAVIGRSDLAWKIATQTSYPSYGYMLNENATTIWESWFFSNDTFSHNHPMFSGVLTWLVGNVGGIRINKSQSIGADRLVFAPTYPPGSNLTYSKATVVTARGTASCSWKCSKEGIMFVNISCPANTRGIVLVDGNRPLSVGAGNFSFAFSGPSCSTNRDIVETAA